MRLLDLFCGGGGCSVGYARAGFQVYGVDHRPQRSYPFAFFEADALDFMRGLLAGATVLGWRLEDFDAFHASPPCQRWSESTPLYARASHPDLIGPIRELLLAAGKPFVIENVDGARRLLRSPLLLCGSYFGLNVIRHRWFEIHPSLLGLVPQCDHPENPVVVSGSAHGRGEAKPAEMIAALGVPWMRVRAEARQAIPPAYTEWIGRQLLAALDAPSNVGRAGSEGAARSPQDASGPTVAPAPEPRPREGPTPA